MTVRNVVRAALSGALALVITSCGSDDSEDPIGNPVAINCGIEGSTGNELGVGKFCKKNADCPPVSSGTALQCSSVLVDPMFPLVCSRLCDLTLPDPGCGTDAVCKDISELGIPLTVCVPKACQPLFTEQL